MHSRRNQSGQRQSQSLKSISAWRFWPGRRRDRLYGAFDRAIDEILSGRVLPFDRTAAETAAVIAAKQRQIGRPVEIRDVQIAGITAARKATLATRNTRHFENLGIILVDPWHA